LTSSFFAYFSQKYFLKKNLYDKIISRSKHDCFATRNGGIAIFSTLILITSFLYLESNQLFDFSLIIPLGILFTIGLYDDLYQVDFKLKFVFQVIAAKIIVDQGIIISDLNGFFGIYEVSYMVGQILTIFSILFIVNASNFSDGIDGLSLTENLKCFMLLLLVSNSQVLNNLNFILIIFITSCLPLYYFNFKSNNKVFLGDSGSLLLGGVSSVGLISLSFSQNLDTINLSLPLIFLMCFMYPLIDTTQVTLKRIFKGLSPFKADNNHIHHLMLKKGLTHLQTLVLISASTGLAQVFLIYYATS
jgi:UDP-N-acetylmuramyl pentapeptide phosphotransferase/UDP-N-acetylglucosamine-1-phosphate transferase